MNLQRKELDKHIVLFTKVYKVILMEHSKKLNTIAVKKIGNKCNSVKIVLQF